MFYRHLLKIKTNWKMKCFHFWLLRAALGSKISHLQMRLLAVISCIMNYQFQWTIWTCPICTLCVQALTMLLTFLLDPYSINWYVYDNRPPCCEETLRYTQQVGKESTCQRNRTIMHCGFTTRLFCSWSKKDIITLMGGWVRAVSNKPPFMFWCVFV